MFCFKCGAKVADGAAFCAACGNPMNGEPVKSNPPVKPVTEPEIRMNGFSRASAVEPEVLLEPKKPVAEAPVLNPIPPAPMAPPAAPRMAPPAPAPVVPPAAPRMAPPAPVPVVPPAAPRMAPPAPMTAAPRMAPPTPAPATPPVPPAPAPATAVPPASPTSQSGDRRISPARELKLLLHQGWLVMSGDRKNLIISLLFPVLAAIIIVWIAGKDMFENHESTKSACFIIVCSAIWCGLFNSIQSIVKERENIKRDYVSGALRIECYTGSRAILQLILCFVQSLVLFLAIPGVSLVYGNDLPEEGVIFGSALVEYFISIFFILMASDAMGLMISAFVKKDELAGKLAPYILIAELLFSGTLFEMKGAAKGLSAVMISRWGMEALGSISDINDIQPRAHMESDNPLVKEIIPYYDLEDFDATSEHVLLVWAVMILFVIVPLVVCNYSLYNVKKDTRS